MNQGRNKLNELETREIIKVLLDQYGYDFSHYSPGHVNRRIKGWMMKKRLNNPDKAVQLICEDEETGLSLVQEFSISVTEMFRNPAFYKAVREQVIPALKTYPHIRIWHAGCATGEEVYSMAILLQEEGIYHRCRIYGTDFNNTALKKAKKGIYSLDRMKKYTRNYQEFEGKYPFSKYYQSRYGAAIMNQSLKKKLVWGDHNLVTDHVFSEVHLIVCKNVMIYFDKKLQSKVFELFTNSLVRGGFLCLGSKETLRFSAFQDKFLQISKKMRIYRMKRE